MHKVLKADIRPSTELDFDELARQAIEASEPTAEHPAAPHFANA
jgi:hypothetical protein